MDATRASLTAKFGAYDDTELLELYRSGELTELASDVARAELAKRGLDTSAPAGPPAAELEADSEPEPVIEGDLVMVARMLDATEAEMLRGRLEAEGVPAMVADTNSSRAMSLIQTAIGGVRILVPDAFLDKARAVLQADARGEYALNEETDVGSPEAQ
jgi:Putative prokaryotic signal transducing protein